MGKNTKEKKSNINSKNVKVNKKEIKAQKKAARKEGKNLEILALCFSALCLYMIICI